MATADGKATARMMLTRTFWRYLAIFAACWIAGTFLGEILVAVAVDNIRLGWVMLITLAILPLPVAWIMWRKPSTTVNRNDMLAAMIVAWLIADAIRWFWP